MVCPALANTGCVRAAVSNNATAPDPVIWPVADVGGVVGAAAPAFPGAGVCRPSVGRVSTNGMEWRWRNRAVAWTADHIGAIDGHAIGGNRERKGPARGVFRRDIRVAGGDGEIRRASLGGRAAEDAGGVV